ncbi:beta strand repeat-containing protein [Tepidimonas charontis]|uniref:Uncharacterized protein n=1 Tax=Tepidimonas charontis TaxID=2267262 RepID=A0A554X207_9BURK|nr:hypothetical protein [Tepidimonas charontis]TSE29874.1 hypothetical protein Tchar_02523 [Tepidimonas charontis]
MNKVEGTAGNDVIEGLFGNSNNATFNAGDTIDGKGGNDTLNLIANGNTASDPVTVKDIDLINVQVATTVGGGATLDALLFTGVGAIHSKDSVGDLTINNLKLGTAVGINNSTKNLTATFTGTSGTSDEVTVEVNKAGSKSGSTTTRSTIDVGSGNTIEAVKLNVLGADNYITINGGNTNKTLTIVGNGTGVADINTTNVVTKVDASAYKGKLDLTLGGTSNVTVIGTAQDDTFRFGTTLNSADTITGGDGTDTLRATLSATQTPTVSGVEKAVLTFTGTNGNYNASKTSGMTVVDVISKSGNSDHISISGAKAELATINALRQSTGDGANPFGNITVAYASGAKADATLNIGGAAAHNVSNVTISNATTVTVQSKDKDATIGGTQTYNDATTLNFIAKDGTLTGSGAITADKVETLNVTADGKDVNIGHASNSFDGLKTLNVTASGAKATVHAEASPGTAGTNIAISEVNVKSANASGEVDVTVEGDMAAAADTFTISTVNFEVNGTSGAQTLKIVTDSNNATIAALNVNAAENATATVVLDESGTGAGYTIQGGVFQGKGNIVIQADTNINAIDLRNIDRTLLGSSSTLTIDDGNNTAHIYGTNGNDVIKVDNGNVTVYLADSLASNGKDTIQNYVGSLSNDRINVQAFLNSTPNAATTAVNGSSNDLDLVTGGNNVGYLYNVTGGTLSANKVVTSSTTANGKVILADNQKAVVLVSAVGGSGNLASNDTFNVYYVYDADSSTTSQNFVVELVATVTAGGNITAGNLLASIV